MSDSNDLRPNRGTCGGCGEWADDLTKHLCQADVERMETEHAEMLALLASILRWADRAVAVAADEGQLDPVGPLRDIEAARALLARLPGSGA